MKKTGKRTNAHQFNSDSLTEQEQARTVRQIRALADVQERDPERAAAGRQAFVSEAHRLAQTVSRQPGSRRIGWTNIFKKERSPMFSLARVILLAAFALGGTGATAYAAQESLPDQALYPVKTWIEDMRLNFSADPQSEFELLSNYIEERVGEIEALVNAGHNVPDHVATRLATHLQLMARVTADMDDPALLKAMEQVRVRSQLQVQRLEQLRENAPPDSPALGLATQSMHNMRTTAEGAVQDPNTFRQRQGTNRPTEAPDIPDNEAPNGGDPANGQGPGSGPGPKNPGGNGG